MFLDIGIGILLSFLVSNIFSTGPELEFSLLGILFALLPDVDILLFVLPKESRIAKFAGGHRGIIHRPIIYGLIAPLIFVIFGNMIGVLFISAVLWHFVHDTLVLGWGIQWWWPFLKRSYKFFPDKNGKITGKLLLSWLPHEENEIRKQYGSPHWIKDFYFTVNPISLIEYSIFILSFLLLYIHFFS